MALNSTVVKAELQISDMDRHYYATHDLTLAQHPSETDQRLMVRVVAFALYASDRLEFGRGLSTEEDPDLWQRDYTGDIDLWIDLGQPDESRIKKACARARQVVVINYSGNSAEIWWGKIASSLTRLKNLTVLDLPPGTVDELAAIGKRGMRLQALIQDRELQLMGELGSVALRPDVRVAPQ
ncbi:YaeQ family protein [Marilutibacter alkalisoli]|uniref:YaeQ family protein n=1 Tax=Marilutibacter alkalisoli TaxID=2591633 RepID=A0A514BS94_9GAMM|nr:YaeQ family protein [Lysobacter alkalisoli]QDH70247.1 YaeQ family protein [Lysobacter alkalisoli]